MTLSDSARQFLAVAIGSIERLDLLLFLYRHATKWWAADTLTAEIDMPADVVQSELEILSARNLLDVRITESVIYRYNPVRADLSRLVEEIAQAHFLHRKEVVTLLTSRAHGSARLFADAFRLRRGKDDG